MPEAAKANNVLFSDNLFWFSSLNYILSTICTQKINRVHIESDIQTLETPEKITAQLQAKRISMELHKM